MTVRDIIKSAAMLLLEEDVLNIVGDVSDDGLGDRDTCIMVKCVNTAAAETRADFPVLSETDAETDNGIIPQNAFSPNAVAVFRVEKNGAPVRFRFDSRGVHVPGNGRYTVTYSPEYKDAALDDRLALGAGMDAESLAYLTARNYCLVTGRTDEASVWDQRYNAEAEKKRLARRTVLPVRRFSY